jgi:hypothetical protein
MRSKLSLLSEAALFMSFVAGVGAYLRRPLTSREALDQVTADLQARNQNFLRVVEAGVFGSPSGPYSKLFRHQGVALADVKELVRTRGVEGALEELYNAGIYVRLNEFKGREPLKRGSFSIDVGSHDFDNPLVRNRAKFETGGSSGRATRIHVDLAHYRQDAIYDRLFIDAYDLRDRPYAIWLSAPPYIAGFKSVMTMGKLGQAPERWFSQEAPDRAWGQWKHAALLRWTLTIGRIMGRPAPSPEHVPVSDPLPVAAWLAAKRAAGTPALLVTNCASAVRACTAARHAGLDITGSVFRVGGEPLTAARARQILAMGCRVTSAYAMGEVGKIGYSCPAPSALDDNHVLKDKVAIIQREVAASLDQRERPILLTTLLASTPKLLINVETGDSGITERRSCGCLFERAGFHDHIHTIRSYDKLTSEGMNFLGSDLLRLVEDVLPQRFGGAPTDYQLVEGESADGLPRVDIVVRPSIGELDQTDVLQTVTDFFNSVPHTAGYGDRWRVGKTLRVVRREPTASSAGKVLALRPARSETSAVG